MSDESLESVLREAMDARVADVHTALPGKIVNYDAEKQVADVQPMVRDVFYDVQGTLKTRSFPVLPSVPVAFLRGGGFFVSLPLAVGDTGMLIFSELPIDRWRSSGQESHPVNARRHGVGNAVFYPGVSPRAKALAEDGVAQNLVLGKEGGAQVHVSASTVNLGEKEAADFVSLAQKNATELNRIKADFTSLVTAIQTALTAGGTSGVGFAGGAAMASAMVFAPSNPSSTAATKVKAT